ncbi:MAG TPA: hypothetical protein VFP10_15730, partial [Candidatus Eisenbacteria bacterium]|nr:hypothetical protein [Candidatus Eisenbacteria bacterium]
FLGPVAGCQGSTREPILGGPCENCELVFVGMPKDIQSAARIAPKDEKGDPLVLEGTVQRVSGDPVPGIIVYAYHTDAGGIYPRSTTRHGRLRAWARSDKDGHYHFDTIRPGSYPSGDNPQHIHMHVIEPGRGTYWIDDVVFDDDPLLTSRHPRHNRGGSGETHPERDEAGVWHVRRNIVLGAEVSGYSP